MLRRLLWMVRKDLLRQLRSPMGILFVLSFPLVFASLLALTFGSGSAPEIPRVKLLVEDLDSSFASGALLDAALGEKTAQYFAVERVGPEGLGRIERNEAAALWRIPQGFQQDLLDGNAVEFVLIKNPAQSILPEIAEQGLTVLAELLSAAARILRDPLDELRPLLDSGTAPTAEQIASLAVRIYETVERSEALLLPPAITLDVVRLTDPESEASGTGGRATPSLIFVIVLPGISVWGLFLVGDIAMRDIVTETRQGTLRRQLCAPLRAGQVIVAKALYTATLSLLSLALLAAIGWVVTRRVVNVPGFLLLSLALILAITGYAALVYGGVRTERQGATISGVLLLVFAFLGGSFIQIQNLPEGLRRVAPFSPFYWGTTGYEKLISSGGGLRAILPHAAVLAALGIVFLSAGAWLLQRKVRGGAA